MFIKVSTKHTLKITKKLFFIVKFRNKILLLKIT